MRVSSTMKSDVFTTSFSGRALDVAELRLAVERDEDGRLLGEDDLRRVVLEALGAPFLAVGDLHVLEKRGRRR